MFRPSLRPPRSPAVCAAAFSLVLASGWAPVRAGEGVPSVAGAAERAAARNPGPYARLSEAETHLAAGRTEAALQGFEDAYRTLPDTPAAREARDFARDGWVRAALARAGELAVAGDVAAARAVIAKAGAPGLAADARLADAAKRLADPDRYPPALTPDHVKRVAEVQRLLMLAGSQREVGAFDAALATYEEVLRLDGYNSAARRGLEGVEQERARYFDAARDNRRSQMLNAVNRAWEQAPGRGAGDLTSRFGGAPTDMATGQQRGGREAIQAKLRDLRIAKVDFNGAALDEVIEYLRVRSRDLDPTQKGVDFVVSLPPDQVAKPVSMNLLDVPLEEVLRYLTELAGVSYRVEDFAVRIISMTESSGDIISKTYRVPPDFISSAPLGGGAAPAASADPFGGGSAGQGNALKIRRMGAKEFLESNGIGFGEGAGASYNPASNMLIVRNTAKNLELVDMLVEQSLNRAPKQVVIDVRLVEIGNNRLQEVGFDWLMAPFGVANNSTQFMGGTVGNAQKDSYLSGDFPRNVTLADGSTTAFGDNPLTAGLRSSGDLGNQGIDGVLFGNSASASKRSPGVLSLSGVLTEPQFQTVLRALDQKKGVDLAAQPSVVARSGQKASLEITRELIYPTEFDPPQIPTNFGQSNVVNIDGTPVQQPLPPAVVTPATPTAFETRKTGVVLEVEPVISDDGRTVDLTVTPQFTDFAGFVNYGSPIRTIFEGAFTELTDNRIFQPVFDSRKVVTSVKVWDGATVVLGGLVSDHEIIIQDKVPVLGDVPYVGRLFKSDVKQRRTRQMIFFVSVKVIDPSGARLNPQ